MSSIKQKIGVCLDCTDGKEKPLIAKRCQNHYWAHRNKLKGGSKLIPRVSKKKQAQDKIYNSVLRPQYMKSHKKCEANLSGCSIYSIEIHHTYSGKDRAKYYLETSTWMAVCRNCHNEIHDNPKKSREIGYLK